MDIERKTYRLSPILSGVALSLFLFLHPILLLISLGFDALFASSEHLLRIIYSNKSILIHEFLISWRNSLFTSILAGLIFLALFNVTQRFFVNIFQKLLLTSMLSLLMSLFLYGLNTSGLIVGGLSMFLLSIPIVYMYSLPHPNN